MLKRALLVGSVVLASVSFGQAQTSGWALAGLAESEPLAGFFGAFRVQPTGIEIRYNVLCYDAATRAKGIPAQPVAFIPDGSALLDMRILSTTAIVEACAGVGITVPRTQVLLPAVQLGL